MKKFKRKNKKLGDIFVYAVLSCLLLNISLLSTSATSPEFSIIMTNKSSNLEFALSGDGQNIVSHGYNWTHLAKIPSRFGEESENIWNITLDDDIMSSNLNLDITYDGSKVVVVDQNEGKFNCYSNVGTTPVWSYQLENFWFATHKGKISEDGALAVIAHENFSPTRDEVIALDGDTGVALWIKDFGLSNVQIIEMDQNGSIIAVGLDNGSVSCYDGLTGEQMWQKQGAAASNINVLAMSEYGNILVSYSRVDFNLTVWDTTNGDVLWTAVMELPYNGIDINQDGTKILLPSWSIDHTSNKIRLYSNDSTAILWETEINAETYSAKISNDGKFVVLGDLSGVVSVLDGNNGSILLEHNTFADNIKEVEISNDGTKFAIRTNEGTITIYDIDVDLGKGSGIAEFFNVLGVYH